MLTKRLIVKKNQIFHQKLHVRGVAFADARGAQLETQLVASACAVPTSAAASRRGSPFFCPARECRPASTAPLELHSPQLRVRLIRRPRGAHAAPPDTMQASSSRRALPRTDYSVVPSTAPGPTQQLCQRIGVYCHTLDAYVRERHIARIGRHL